MEDFKLDIVIGKGPAARSIRLDLPRFTVIGATTRTGSLAAPLRDRFGHIYRLEFYEPEDIAKIVTRSAAILESSIRHEAANLLSTRARLTPRIANRLLKRVRDYADVNGDGITIHLSRERGFADIHSFSLVLPSQSFRAIFERVQPTRTQRFPRLHQGFHNGSRYSELRKSRSRP